MEPHIASRIFYIGGKRLYERVHEILVLIMYDSSEGSDKPALMHSLARAFATCTHKENRDIFGAEFEWAMKMGQWPMFHSFAFKNQDFNGPFVILMVHLEKMMGPRNLNICLTAK